MRLLLVIMVLSFCAHGQQLKKFRFGIGYGRTLNWPTYSGYQSASGSAFYIEPSYRITNRLVAGYRLELGTSSMFIARSRGSIIASHGLNAHYLLSDKALKPLIGFGFGFYKPYLSGTPPDGMSSRQEETIIGVYPRIGFEYGHLIILMEYNFAPVSRATITRYESGPMSFSTSEAEGELANSYGCIKLGLIIGGGLKKS